MFGVWKTRTKINLSRNCGFHTKSIQYPIKCTSLTSYLTPKPWSRLTHRRIGTVSTVSRSPNSAPIGSPPDGDLKHQSTVNPGGQAPKKKNLIPFKWPLKPTTQFLTKNIKEAILCPRPQLYEQALSGETCKTLWGIISL